MCVSTNTHIFVLVYKVIDRIYTSGEISSSISFPFERLFANSAAHAFSADDLYTNRENRISWVLLCRGIFRLATTTERNCENQISRVECDSTAQLVRPFRKLGTMNSPWLSLLLTLINRSFPTFHEELAKSKLASKLKMSKLNDK